MIDYVYLSSSCGGELRLIAGRTMGLGLLNLPSLGPGNPSPRLFDSDKGEDGG